MKKLTKNSNAPPQRCVPVKTRFGTFLIQFDEKGRIFRLHFPRQFSAAQFSTHSIPKRKERRAVQFLRDTLDGKKPRAKWKLALAQGTLFQQKVWKALTLIPVGETRSYAWVASRIDRPKAVRAVGNACSQNPVPVFIPCHRVVGKSGGLGGFSSGIRWKKRLLHLEKCKIRDKIL